MSEISQQELEDISTRYQELMASQQTLLLSTASTDGVPDISYAPFVRDHEGVFYIYVSEMVGHTVNLLNNPQASLLFIQAESEARNLFARERAVLNCSVKEISRDEAIYADRIQALAGQIWRGCQSVTLITGFPFVCLASGKWPICRWFWPGL